jgi:hypothetical protein
MQPDVQDSPAPSAPTIGQVFTPGGSPPPSAAPENNTLPTTFAAPSSQQVGTMTPSQPSGMDPMMSASSMQVENEKKKGFKPSKKIALIALVPLLLIGGSAAAYFGYIVPNKPENVWKSALTNTGKGYDKLSSYATAKKNVQGVSAKGSFKISGSVAADGTFNGMSDGKNGQLTGNISAAGLKINYDLREIESPGNSPDVYTKIDGIQGLGDLVGGYARLLGGDSSQLTNALNGLNGQWYFIDHTLFDQFAKGSNDGLQITSADISGALKAVGDSSKQYLFTDNPDKMAIVVKQNVGKEKQDNRTVYHYKVGIDKDNLKAYNQSLCDNLIKTKLFKLFETSSSGDQDLGKECAYTTGIDKIKDGQTADVWVDMRTKLIHKIRFTDSKNKNSYTDISQDYQGGDEFPFSIATHSQSSVDNNDISSSGNSKTSTSDGLVKMKLNMKTNTFTLDANFEDKSGSSDDKGTFSLTIAPSEQKVKVDKPTNAKTIIQLMNDLGFGDLVSDTASGNQAAAKDAERKTDINALRSQLEVYYTENGSYPTLANLNDANWRKTNMKSFDESALKDPDGSQSKLATAPTAKVYSYQPTPAGCNGTNCSGYTLAATLDNGTAYTKQSLNQ